MYIDNCLFRDLFDKAFTHVIEIKKNVKNKLMSLSVKILLRKRFIIKTVNSILKEDLGVVHTRHRSFINGFVHMFSALATYVFEKNKPACQAL